MSTPRDERQKDLFRPALDQIIDLKHPLVLLAEKIDWSFINGRFRSGRAEKLIDVTLAIADVKGTRMF